MSFVIGKKNPLEGTVSGKTVEPPDKSLFGPIVPREPQQTRKPAAGAREGKSNCNKQSNQR